MTTIILTGVAQRDEDGLFVSCCRELGTYSCGDTEYEALENLGEAIDVYLAALSEVGGLEQVLSERGILVLDEPPIDEIAISAPVGSTVKTYAHTLHAA